VLFAFVVLLLNLVSSVGPYYAKRFGYEKTSPKRPILCRVAHNSLTQSIKQSTNQSINLVVTAVRRVNCDRVLSSVVHVRARRHTRTVSCPSLSDATQLAVTNLTTLLRDTVTTRTYRRLLLQ